MKFFERRKVPVFRSLSGDLRLIENRFCDGVNIPDFTIDNPDAPSIDLSQKWGDNYGHWIFDILPGVLFHNFPEKKVILSDVSIHHHHTVQYLRALGFSNIGLGFADCVVVNNPLAFTGMVNPAAVRILRGLIPMAINKYPFGRLNLMVQRSSNGCGCLESRNLWNRAAISDKFESLGIPITMVYLEGVPVLQQISMFAQAGIVIGVHGSGMANVIYCNSDCRILEIQAPHHYNSTFAEAASFLGLNFKTLIGSVLNPGPNLDCYRYSLNVEIQHVLELLECEA